MKIKERVAKLIDLKSIIMLILTLTMVALLFYPKEINKELLMLFSTSYGGMIAYYFNRTKKDGENNGTN